MMIVFVFNTPFFFALKFLFLKFFFMLNFCDRNFNFSFYSCDAMFDICCSYFSFVCATFCYCTCLCCCIHLAFLNFFIHKCI